MGEENNFINDEAIFSKVTTIMEKLQKDQELQDLAERNGVNGVNAIRLTPTTQENVAVAAVSLLLAQKSGDSRYRKLSQMGLQKRSLKAEIINDHKDEAIALIKKYRDSKTI